MSHIVQITTQVTDEAAVKATCIRLTLPAPEHKTVRLFSATATGLCIQLPGWRYPVVADQLIEDLERCAYQFLPAGFEINDGGQGDLYLDIAAGILRLEHQENFIDTRSSSREWRI